MNTPNYNRMSIKRLKLEFVKLKLDLPQKGTGTGKKRRVVKRDLVAVLNLHQKNKIGPEFTLKMEPDLIKVMLKNMKISDILNFCKTSKLMHKVCSDTFWREISSQKLGITKIGKYKSWGQLVNDLRYGTEDLYTIGRLYINDIWSKKESEYAIEKLYERHIYFSFKTKIVYIDTNILNFVLDYYDQYIEDRSYSGMMPVELREEAYQAIFNLNLQVYYSIKTETFEISKTKLNYPSYLEIRGISLDDLENEIQTRVK